MFKAITFAFAALAFFIPSPVLAGSDVVILSLPGGGKTGRTSEDTQIRLAKGEHASLIDQEGRLVRIDGPFVGPISERLGKKDNPGIVEALFDTVLKLLSSEPEDRSKMGVARGDGSSLRELQIDGTDSVFCVVDDSPLSVRLQEATAADAKRYDFLNVDGELQFSLVLGRSLTLGSWSYEGQSELKVYIGGHALQHVRIEDLRTVAGDLLALEMARVGCDRQMPALVEMILANAE